MSLSKAILQGKIVRKPEKRFSSNNVAVTTFAIDISPNEDESIVRVVTLGKTAELAEQKLSQGVMVVVDGRLQTNTIKTADGEEKKVVELDAQNFEIVAGGSSSTKSTSSKDEDLLQLSDEDFSDDLIGEDEIPF